MHCLLITLTLLLVITSLQYKKVSSAHSSRSMNIIILIVGASEAKPLSSGWCENRKFGTSRLRNSFRYVAVAQ